MKKGILILLAVLFSTMQIKAYNFELDGIYYNFIEGTTNNVEVTYPIEYRHDDYDGEGDYYGVIIIPEIVTYKNKHYRVTSIGEQAFRESSVVAVTVPKSVEYIGVGAFRDCCFLEKIEVQWSVPLDLREVEKTYPKHSDPYYNYVAEDIFDFSEEQRQRITLVVPINTKTLYQEWEVWKYFVNIEEKGFKNKISSDPKRITILDGTVSLELTGGANFPCIGLQLADRNIGKALGTYLEIKKGEEFYLMKYKYEIKQYNTINKAVEGYLEDLFKRFCEDKQYGDKVWKAFVQEGGLQLFLQMAEEFMDEEFLTSPFNEIYG